ncbi:MAG: [Fe-S]-binding protein [Candidatus Thorarchaeota archaeon]|nr:MAG: [Fe-S]-binding protein [Candidatus Thorarchaeota archaeon]
MGFKQKLSKAMITKAGPSRIKGMIAKQKSLSNHPAMLLPTSTSPTRFEIPFEMLKLLKERNDIEMRQVFPIRQMLSIMRNINLSVDSLSKNPSIPSTSASVEFLEQLKDFANSLGVGPFEFVKLPTDLIFQDFGVIYDNAIIIALEMSKEKIDKAPSQDTIDMVFGTYDELGIAANKIADFLREQGYAAQADHPLGGLVLFPPLAQKAGIGRVGKHGLLITPEFGPRVRLAAVYTSIQNLPFADTNYHDWIDEYCKICGICIKQCPPQAILEEAVTHDTGRITNITQQSCFEYFTQFYGCSICVKVCPFSNAGDTYERLKVVIEKRI